VDDGQHQQTLGIDNNMSLLPFNHFASIIARRIDVAAPFLSVRPKRI